MARAPSPLRRVRSIVRKITDGDEPLVDTLRENRLRVRLEGDAILIEPFEMDNSPIMERNKLGSETGLKIERLAAGDANHED